MRAPRQDYLCSLSLPDHDASRLSRDSSSSGLTPENLLDERHRVIESGLSLLSPLRGTCLYHSLEWFTYSLCFGEAVRQFRAIDVTVGGGRVPAQDPNQDAYVLGRWRDDLDKVGGKIRYQTQEEVGVSSRSARHLAIEKPNRLPSNDAAGSALSPSRIMEMLDAQDDENGTELMQIIRFASNGDEQRYLSQIWLDGTLCDINDEPRSVEVQYHCNPALSGSRISLVKETTTCNYVMIVETPLTCQEKQLLVGREGKRKHGLTVGEWKCSRIVEDDISRSPTSAIGFGNSADPAAADEPIVETGGPLPGTDSSLSASKPSKGQAESGVNDVNLHTTSSPPWLPTPENPSLSSEQYFALGVDYDGNVVVDLIDSWASDLLYQQEQLKEQQQHHGHRSVDATELLERLLTPSRAAGQGDAGQAASSDEETDTLEARISRLMYGDYGSALEVPKDADDGKVDAASKPRLRGAALFKALREVVLNGQGHDGGEAALNGPDERPVRLLRLAGDEDLNDFVEALAKSAYGSGYSNAQQRGESDSEQLKQRGKSRDDAGTAKGPRDDKWDIFAELNAEARRRTWKPQMHTKADALRTEGADGGQNGHPASSELQNDAGQAKDETRQRGQTLAERVEEFYRNRHDDGGQGNLLRDEL